MRVAAIAEAGQKRCVRWLGIVEGKLGDGRKYAAGDEFTAAGVARPWRCYACLR